MAGSPLRLFALLCAVYVAQSAHRGPDVDAVDGPSADVSKRSTYEEDKRGFRPDLGKREDEDDRALRQSLSLLTDRRQRSRGRFRGDLGKRRSSFRGDLGKRPFRGDLGKRADMDDEIVSDGELAARSAAEKRPFRGDLGKRSRSFRGDLGKRDAPAYEPWTQWSDGAGDEEDERRRHVDFSKRRYGFRGDLGKRRAASFRGDLGK